MAMDRRPPPHGRSGGGRRPSDRGARATRPRDGGGDTAPRALAPGLGARMLAADLVSQVLARGRALDDALATPPAFAAALEPRDRGFARLIAATTLRRLGQIEAVLAAFLERPLPPDSGRARAILQAASAQILFLASPAHAVINAAVEQCRKDERARRFDRLANAVLRRVAENGPAIVAAQDEVSLNMPPWLMQRWIAAYGGDQARAIAAASLREAALDIAVRGEAQEWAERLGARVLPTGALRLLAEGRVDRLPGFAEGAWWVQDAAAQLPARLLGEVRGRSVGDLCAAPGGKTAELACAGARVTAVDRSAERLQRLRENLTRLDLQAETVVADVGQWSPPAPFDAVILDAPCTATGTIRRHPDILRLKRAEDVVRLAAIQARLLAQAARTVAPGGVLVYCVCSLEPEEGREQVARFLAGSASFRREPVRPAEIGAEADWITPEGDLRTLPSHMQLDDERLSGLDGFYAARLRHQG